jgi:hypothetical protein
LKEGCAHLQERKAQDAWDARLSTLRKILGLWGAGAAFILTGLVLPSALLGP